MMVLLLDTDKNPNKVRRLFQKATSVSAPVDNSQTKKKRTDGVLEDKKRIKASKNVSLASVVHLRSSIFLSNQ